MAKLKFPEIAVLVGIFLAVLTGGMTLAAQDRVTIQFENGLFRVSGWRPPAKPPANGWESVFAVYAGEGDVPPMLGFYTVEAGSLVFHPKFPIAAGVRYRAIFHPPGGGAATETDFSGPPKETTPRARVLHIYPSGDSLPSNQLRLYIYFSEPMSRGESARFLHVLDARGKPLQNIFLPGEELWDPNFERLTMTFDPGRIKRGLTSNQAIGPPIMNGKRYTLVIDRDWQDARGVPMVEGFRKQFRGGPAIRTAPDPKTWRITPPKAGTFEILVVDFPEPMNYALLQRMIQVAFGRSNAPSGSAKASAANATSGVLRGNVSIANHETEWRFEPQEPWKAGDYRLVVDTGLEDLAGNHVGELFDIDTFNTVTEHITSQNVSLPFAIR